MKKRNISIRFIALILTAILTLSYLVACENKSQNSKNENTLSAADTMSLHFVDVGQGDGMFIITPGGKYIMIDCGPAEAADIMAGALSDSGCKEIEYAVFTHPHADHISGNYPIFKNFRIHNIIMSDVETDTFPYQKLLRRADNSGADVSIAEAGTGFDVDGVHFDIIGPSSEMVKKINSEPESSSGLNNGSVALKIKYKDFTFLTCGDAEKEEEEYMLRNFGSLLPSLLYKTSHHGSTTSNSDAFLDAVSPKYAVVSCGAGNEYGHPHRDLVKELEKRGIEIYRTDTDGDITVNTDGMYINITAEK